MVNKDEEYIVGGTANDCIDQYMVLFRCCSLGGNTAMPGRLRARLCRAFLVSVYVEHCRSVRTIAPSTRTSRCRCAVGRLSSQKTSTSWSTLPLSRAAAAPPTTPCWRQCSGLTSRRTRARLAGLSRRRCASTECRTSDVGSPTTFVAASPVNRRSPDSSSATECASRWSV